MGLDKIEQKSALPPKSPETVAKENEGLEIIHRIGPFLDEVMWEHWMRSDGNTFMKPPDAYTAKDLDTLSDKSKQEVVDRQARLPEIKKNWERDLNKEYGDFVEQLVAIGITKLQWLGGSTVAKQSEETDDVFSSTDIVVRLGAKIADHDEQQLITIDTTDQPFFGIQKVSNHLRFINYGLLSSVKFGDGAEADLLPHFVLVISHERTAELAQAVETAMQSKDWEALAAHPVQFEILEQLDWQLAAYQAWFDNLPSEKGTIAQQLGERVVNDKGRRGKVAAALEKTRTLLDKVVAERRDVIRRYSENAPADITEKLRAFTESDSAGDAVQPDKAHEQFLKLFDKMGVDQYRRFKALLTVMPPRVADKTTGKKEPIAVGQDPNNRKPLTPRFGNLVGIGPDEIEKLRGTGKQAEENGDAIL